MSAQRWGVKVKYSIESETRCRALNGDRKPFAGSRREAYLEAARWDERLEPRVVKLIPKKRERRVVEGPATEDSVSLTIGHAGPNVLFRKLYVPSDLARDLHGKRVRLTVEVLPDAKEKP